MNMDKFHEDHILNKMEDVHQLNYNHRKDDHYTNKI